MTDWLHLLKLAEQIEQLESYRQQNNSLNAVLLERDFDQESRRIDETVGELQAFKTALFDTTECGLSAKELYLLLPLSIRYWYWTMSISSLIQQTDAFTCRLADYAAYQQRLQPGINGPKEQAFPGL